MGHSRWAAGVAGLVLLVALVVPAMDGGLSSAATVSSRSPSVAGVSLTDAAGTVWLCRPGLAADPCSSNLDSTAVLPTGQRTVERAPLAPDPPFDCFYVYPTVSKQSTDNANLEIQASEIGAAVAQAAPFSQVCRIWAPVYRQRTDASLAKGLGSDPTGDRVAYQSLVAGWTDYLAHFNDGRPVIFIGHSQGAAMLVRLLASRIDSNPKLRRRMVSAIIAGGNVAVPTGRTVGSTFQHLPLCAMSGQSGCVIAYSSFPKRPPAKSLFGRPGQGVSLQSGQTASIGVQVACVNPAAVGGGVGVLDPWFIATTLPPPPPAISTPWVTYPELYTASCVSSDGATWLQVNDVVGPGDARPVVTEALGPRWGFHLDDINLATGNLVNDVRMQEQAYTASHG